jgi:AcrR family transcriptional regulator
LGSHSWESDGVAARKRKTRAISPRKRPAQARSRATVEALLDATARILVRRGLAGASTNAVAAAAGVSVGSLYQYFPSKHALVSALHERHARELLAVLDCALAEDRARSFERTVEALVRALVEAHRVNPALHRVLEGEAAELDAADALDDVLAERVRGLLEAHRERVASPDLALATRVVMRIVHTLVHAAVLEAASDAGAEAMTRETVRAVLGYLEHAS